MGSRSTSTGFYGIGTEFREVYPDAVTLPQYFRNHGHVAHSMGKIFHIGHGNTNDDVAWSVPHHPDKVIDYVLPESNNRGGGNFTLQWSIYGETLHDTIHYEGKLHGKIWRV